VFDVRKGEKFGHLILEIKCLQVYGSGKDWELTTVGLMTTTQWNLILFDFKFVMAQYKNRGSYVVWKPLLSPCDIHVVTEESHLQGLAKSERGGGDRLAESRVEQALNPVSMSVLKCARQTIAVHPCMRLKDLLPCLRLAQLPQAPPHACNPSFTHVLARLP